MFVITLYGMYVKEVALDGKLYKTHLISEAKKFDEPAKLHRYMDFLRNDGYSVDFKTLPD
jgi:hypothetical protein